MIAELRLSLLTNQWPINERICFRHRTEPLIVGQRGFDGKSWSHPRLFSAFAYRWALKKNQEYLWWQIDVVGRQNKV